METEYLDEEQVIALYNKVRTGKRTWPTGIWSSPAALQYAVTVFDYWVHNVMGWKGWPDARGKVTPALLEEHRLADLVESVFVPEFGDDWLDFEVVLNESMRLSEEEAWSPELTDRQERVEAAFEHGWEQVIYKLEQEILVEEPGVVSYSVWQKGFVGEFYRCADCGELHSQFDEDTGNELRLNDLEPPDER